MVMSVTKRNGGPRLMVLGSPFFGQALVGGVIEKAPGAHLFVRWRVQNTGDEIGWVSIYLSHQAGSTPFFSPIDTPFIIVGPGSTSYVTLDWTLNAGFIAGTAYPITAELWEVDESEGPVAQLSGFNFTLRVQSVAVGPILEPVGDPVIS